MSTALQEYEKAVRSHASNVKEQLGKVQAQFDEIDRESDKRLLDYEILLSRRVELANEVKQHESEEGRHGDSSLKNETIEHTLQDLHTWIVTSGKQSALDQRELMKIEKESDGNVENVVALDRLVENLQEELHLSDAQQSGLMAQFKATLGTVTKKEAKTLKELSHTNSRLRRKLGNVRDENAKLDRDLNLSYAKVKRVEAERKLLKKKLAQLMLGKGASAAASQQSTTNAERELAEAGDAETNMKVLKLEEEIRNMSLQLAQSQDREFDVKRLLGEQEDVLKKREVELLEAQKLVEESGILEQRAQEAAAKKRREEEESQRRLDEERMAAEALTSVAPVVVSFDFEETTSNDSGDAEQASTPLPPDPMYGGESIHELSPVLLRACAASRAIALNHYVTEQRGLLRRLESLFQRLSFVPGREENSTLAIPTTLVRTYLVNKHGADESVVNSFLAQLTSLSVSNDAFVANLLKYHSDHLPSASKAKLQRLYHELPSPNHITLSQYVYLAVRYSSTFSQKMHAQVVGRLFVIFSAMSTTVSKTGDDDDIFLSREDVVSAASILLPELSESDVRARFNNVCQDSDIPWYEYKNLFSDEFLGSLFLHQTDTSTAPTEASNLKIFPVGTKDVLSQWLGYGVYKETAEVKSEIALRENDLFNPTVTFLCDTADDILTKQLASPIVATPVSVITIEPPTPLPEQVASVKDVNDAPDVEELVQKRVEDATAEARGKYEEQIALLQQEIMTLKQQHQDKAISSTSIVSTLPHDASTLPHDAPVEVVVPMNDKKEASMPASTPATTSQRPSSVLMMSPVWHTRIVSNKKIAKIDKEVAPEPKEYEPIELIDSRPPFEAKVIIPPVREPVQVANVEKADNNEQRVGKVATTVAEQIIHGDESVAVADQGDESVSVAMSSEDAPKNNDDSIRLDMKPSSPVNVVVADPIDIAMNASMSKRLVAAHEAQEKKKSPPSKKRTILKGKPHQTFKRPSLKGSFRVPVEPVVASSDQIENEAKPKPVEVLEEQLYFTGLGVNETPVSKPSSAVPVFFEENEENGASTTPSLLRNRPSTAPMRRPVPSSPQRVFVMPFAEEPVPEPQRHTNWSSTLRTPIPRPSTASSKRKPRPTTERTVGDVGQELHERKFADDFSVSLLSKLLDTKSSTDAASLLEYYAVQGHGRVRDSSWEKLSVLSRQVEYKDEEAEKYRQLFIKERQKNMKLDKKYQASAGRAGKVRAEVNKLYDRKPKTLAVTSYTASMAPVTVKKNHYMRRRNRK